MTGAVQTAGPAAPAAGNGTLLSAGGDAPSDTPPVTPTPGDNSGNENKPVDPSPGNGDKSPATEPPKEGESPKEGEEEQQEGQDYGAFTAPPGVDLDPVAIDEFKPVAKELGLTQEQAQKLVGVVAGMQQRQQEAHVAQVKEWEQAVTTDKDIGGAKWPENQALVARARDQFVTPELRDLMDQTGLGSHPAVIKLFVHLGKAIADDGHVIGGAPAQPTDFATDYFDKMPKRERVR
jgi:hypothetical protein